MAKNAEVVLVLTDFVAVMAVWGRLARFGSLVGGRAVVKWDLAAQVAIELGFKDKVKFVGDCSS